MTCKCSTFKITNCEHCGFPRYGYNKYDYYDLATDYYISSNLTLFEIAIKVEKGYRLQSLLVFVLNIDRLST